MEANRPQLEALLGQLLQIQRDARELGEHEVSFHALSAAAHAAERLGDQDALDRVAQLSRDQLAWLTATDPDHRLVAGVATRNHQSVFEQLAVTAGAMRQRLHADDVLDTARARMAARPIP
jgi:hypothetical protein